MRLIDADAMRENIERIKQNVEEWVNQTECDITKALVRISLYEEFIDLIDNAPTVEVPTYTDLIEANKEGYNNARRLYERSKGEWIPVSEKLPPNYIICLFCDIDGDIYYGHRTSENNWYAANIDDKIPGVVAWQELPEPYKEGGTE